MPPNNSLCEESNYSKVFRTYAKTLFNYLFYKTGNRALAQDLVQEAFTKLWQNCAEVAYPTAKGYVFKIANNLLINEYNHQKVVMKFQSIPRSDRSDENPEFLMEEKEFKEKLETAIAQLPEKQRVVFLMSRIEKKNLQRNRRNTRYQQASCRKKNI